MQQNQIWHLLYSTYSSSSSKPDSCGYWFLCKWKALHTQTGVLNYPGWLDLRCTVTAIINNEKQSNQATSESPCEGGLWMCRGFKIWIQNVWPLHQTAADVLGFVFVCVPNKEQITGLFVIGKGQWKERVFFFFCLRSHQWSQSRR